MLKGILADSMKSLGSYYNNYDSGSNKQKSIMNAPYEVHDRQYDEEAKKILSPPDLDNHIEPLDSSMPLNSDINLNSPLTHNYLLSPLNEFNNSDQTPLPSYLSNPHTIKLNVLFSKVLCKLRQ